MTAMKGVQINDSDVAVSEHVEEGEDTMRGDNEDLLQNEDLDNMINPIIFVRGI